MNDLKVEILSACRSATCDDFELMHLLNEGVRLSSDGEFCLEFFSGYGKTPLLLAAGSGNKMCVSVLLKYGADITVTDDNGCTALHDACLSGNASTVSLLLRHGASVNARTLNGATPLMVASRSDKVECVELLLEWGADVDERNTNDSTALHGAKAAVASILVAHGADIESKDSYGKTPLMDSVVRGDGECATLLLDSGSDVNGRDHFGWTPLMCASYLGRTGCVGILLSRGADIEATNDHGESVDDVASNDATRATLGRYRQVQANWCVLAPLLKCADIHANSSFSQSVDAMLPIIRRYAGFSDELKSRHEMGSSSCVSFLTSSYAKTAIL